MKICSKCGGDPKPNSAFYKNCTKPDGLHSACRECMSSYYAPSQKAKRARQRATERSAIMRRRAYPQDNHANGEVQDLQALTPFEREAAANAYLNELLAALLPPHLVQPVSSPRFSDDRRLDEPLRRGWDTW